MAETSNDPVCEKCGAPIQSGFQFAYCPHKQQCALYPTGSPADVTQLADEMIGDCQP